MNEDLSALRDFTGVARLFPLPGLVFFPHAVQPLHIANGGTNMSPCEPHSGSKRRQAAATDRLRPRGRPADRTQATSQQVLSVTDRAKASWKPHNRF